MATYVELNEHLEASR